MTKELEAIFIRLVKELNIVSDEHYLELYLQENKPPEIAKDIALACFMKRYEDEDTDKVRDYLIGLYWPNTIKG